MSQPLLAFDEVDVFYGPIQALKQVSLTVNEGETVALIGANGAGKSTLLMSVFGQPRIAGGEIFYRGEAISRKSTHFIASNGIAQAPEGRRIFPDMTVEENLLMGTIAIGNRYQAEDKARMYQLFPRLEERRGQRAMTLSGGEQQRVQLARCLAQLWRDGAPQGWLFLDEPTSALDLYYQQHLLRLLKRLTAGGQLHVCVVLHDLNLAALWPDRILLLHQGHLVAQGTPQEVIQQPVIHRWYGADVRLVQHPDNAAPQVYLAP